MNNISNRNGLNFIALLVTFIGLGCYLFTLGYLEQLIVPEWPDYLTAIKFTTNSIIYTLEGKVLEWSLYIFSFFLLILFFITILSRRIKLKYRYLRYLCGLLSVVLIVFIVYWLSIFVCILFPALFLVFYFLYKDKLIDNYNCFNNFSTYTLISVLVGLSFYFCYYIGSIREIEITTFPTVFDNRRDIVKKIVWPSEKGDYYLVCKENDGYIFQSDSSHFIYLPYDRFEKFCRR